MVLGWRNLVKTHSTENDEDCNGANNSELVVDEGTSIPLQNSKTTQVVSTGSSQEFLAKEKKIGKKLHADVAKAELRVRYLRNLTYLGLGTNRIEMNQIKSHKELMKDTGRNVAEIKQEMTRKTKDAERDA